MKRFFSYLAATAMLFAASCSNEDLGTNDANDTQVTFNLSLEGQSGTRAIGDGTTVNKLCYAVFDEQNNLLAALTGNKENAFANGSETVSLKLAKDQDYTVVFWAQHAEAPYTLSDDKKTVTINYKKANNENVAGNDEKRDAFFKAHKIEDLAGSGRIDVVLERPFAQLNVGVTAKDYQDAEHSGVEITKSWAKVTGVYNTLNLFDGSVDGETTAEFAMAATPKAASDETLTVGQDAFEYLSMNYVLVGAKKNVTAEFEFATNSYVDENNKGKTIAFKSGLDVVPVERNYRTNLVGQILTGNLDFNVTIDADFDGDENIQPQFKVVEYDYLEDALADNTSKEPVTYNVKGLKDETNVTVTIPRTFIAREVAFNFVDSKANSNLKIESEDDIYANTVAISTPEAVIIENLTVDLPNAHVILSQGKFNYIDAKTSSSTLVISSGVTVGTQLKVQQGAVEIKKGGEVAEIKSANSSTPVVVRLEDEDDMPVVAEGTIIATEETDSESESNAMVINLDKDIELTDVMLLDRNTIINGNGNKIISTANRIIRITKGDIEVTFNNVNFVSRTVMQYPNDIRGVSIDNVQNVVLTLNQCSVDFTDASACDWAYAVNQSGDNSSNNTIVINGGTYEGANVINIWGSNHKVNIDGATLNCLYAYNSQYWGLCVKLMASGNEVSVKNTTFNGTHAVAIEAAAGNTITEENNIDNTKYYVADVDGVGFYNLQDAIGAANGQTVKIIKSFKLEGSVTIPAGAEITLDLNGRTITGIDNTEKNYGLIQNNGTLVITNSTEGQAKMFASATHNNGWDRYSAVISNNPGGVLTVNENILIEHQGGTDMAYGIDILTNGNIGDVMATINGATVKSNYRAIRQFLNSDSKQNELIIKAGSVIEGENKGIFFHDPSAKANNGKLIVEDGARVNSAYLFVTEGSTKWPVEVSIAKTAMNLSDITTKNVPETYELIEEGNNYVVASGWRAVIAKAENGSTITLDNDIELTETIVINGKDITFDLNGKTVTAPSSSAFEAIEGGKLTIKNGKVIAYESTVRAIGGEVVVESGEYISTGTALDSPATYRYSIDSREGGKITINGGTFKSNNGMINVGSEVVINGGKFENIVEKTMTRHFAYVSALLTINDGEFYGKANSNGGGCFFCGAAAGGDIQVNGGKFTSLWTSGSVNRIFEVYFGGTITVKGGMFNTNGGISNFVVANTDEATKAAYPYVAK